MRPVAMLALAATLSSGLPAQQDDKCTIAGTVVNNATGEPLRKARISVGGGQEANVGAITDATGHYSVSGLQPGRYNVTASLNGFIGSGYGARGTGGRSQSIALESGSKRTDIDFRLIPQSVISGRVLDPDGDPVPNVLVQSMRWAYSGGRKHLQPGGGTSTNDKGDYRLYSLAPGKYLVLATYHGVPVTGSETFTSTYYPSSHQPEGATPIDLAPGIELRAVDVSMVRARGYRVRGKVVDHSGAPMRASVSLSPVNGTGDRSGSAVRNEKGEFELQNVTPGTYLLVLRPSNDGGIGVPIPLEVGSADIDDLVLRYEERPEIPGRLVVEGHPDATLNTMRVNLESGIPNTYPGASTPTEADGSFRLQNAWPGATLNVFGLAADQYVKQIRLGETDITQGAMDIATGQSPALVITIGSKAATVTGSVQDDKQKAMVNATVVLVPTDAEKRKVARLYKVAFSGADGNFRIQGIAPGDYKLFAWDQVEQGAWQDPDFLKPLESLGESVSLQEGSTETRQLKAIAP